MSIMINIFRNVSTKASPGALLAARSMHLSPLLRLKEIQEKKEGNTLVVEGVTVSSPRQHLLIDTPPDKSCRLCSLGIDVKHTDVLILSQYLRSDGCMLPRRITGLCKKQQRKVTILVAMAQKAGLMSNLAPANSKRDPKQRFRWKKFNTYFDESTITFKY